jgi:hypothetical protein
MNPKPVIKFLAILLLTWPFSVTLALAGDDSGVTYTISAEEALHGPKPIAANYIIDSRVHEAAISVNAGKVLARVNPLVFGACFEDLNHEIYGGLYAQMIFGESFEEGPEKELPPGWRLHADWLENPTWEGMWCSENDAIGMTGFRWYKLLWEGTHFEDGAIECELMQPAFDPGRPIGLLFRAGGHQFHDAYAVMLDAQVRRLELRIGERGVAFAPVSTKLGEWLAVRVEASGTRIRVFAGRELAIDFAGSEPPAGGLVGFDTTESRGWFRKLKIETGGKTHTPPLAPVRPTGYRGPVSQWWEPVVTGNVDVAFGWDADRPFNTLRSQKIELRAGTGTVGVANSGLHRFGLSVVQGRAYEGRLYLRGKGEVTVALQNADGSRTYATQRLAGIEAGWKRFPFSLTVDSTDHRARFAVWIDHPGAVWVDQVVLMPTGDGLFKGLPVRADLAQAVVDSGVTCIRLGGDFSNPPGFRWKAMLGDPDRRPQYNSCWYPFETRGWGMIEFIDFCRASGIEPIPCLNHDETPADVAELVRRYQLRYIQLGNGFAGIERTAAVADAMHAVDREAKLLSGSIGHVADVLPDAARLQEMKAKLGGKVHAMAAFPYNFEVTGHASWQVMLNRLGPLRGVLKIYSQEVNGGNHNLLRGLADAAFHNVTEQNAEFVDLVTYCGMVEADGTAADNGWDQGRIFFNNHQVWLQPHAWTIRMAREQYQPLAVETTTTCPKMTFKDPIPYGVPVIDVLVASAARSEKGDVLALKVVNFAPFALTTKVNIAGMAQLAPVAKTVLLTGEDLKLENTAEQPHRIAPVTGQRDGIGPEFVHVFPAYSYTIQEVRGSR